MVNDDGKMMDDLRVRVCGIQGQMILTGVLKLR